MQARTNIAKFIRKNGDLWNLAIKIWLFLIGIFWIRFFCIKDTIYLASWSLLIGFQPSDILTGNQN